MSEKEGKGKVVKNQYDLFDNPMINAARKALSEEDKKRYETIGKEMYNTIDFETSKVLNNMPPPMQEAVLYVEEGLKSGLLPKDLEDDEKVLMKEAYGEKWYVRFGYNTLE